jgi:hypothetical protein
MFSKLTNRGAVMSWRSDTSSEREIIVYRNGPHIRGGLLLILAGVAASLATGRRYVEQASTDDHSLLVGILVSIGIAVWGAALLAAREVSLDVSQKRIRRTWRWLFFSGEVTESINEQDTVEWIRRRVDGKSRYSIQLTGPPDDSLVLFDLVRMQDARLIAEEISAFLGWNCRHWDDELISAAQQPRSESSDLVASIRSLTGHRPMSPDEDPSRLEFRQGFDAMLRLFGAAFLVVGAVPVALVLAGVTIIGNHHDPLFPLLLGLSFAVIGALLLLGKRGITLTRPDRTACLWWGLPRPLWVKRIPLREDADFGLTPKVIDSTTLPYVAWQVVATGQDGSAVTLFQSPVREESESIHGRIVQFFESPDGGL